MIKPQLAELGANFEISILGVPHRASVIPETPFDPENERLKG